MKIFHKKLLFSVSYRLSLVELRPSSSLSTGCVVSLGGIEPFSAALAQDELAECDQPGRNPLQYSG